jgi:hypothetical protein
MRVHLTRRAVAQEEVAAQVISQIGLRTVSAEQDVMAWWVVRVKPPCLAMRIASKSIR